MVGTSHKSVPDMAIESLTVDRIKSLCANQSLNPKTIESNVINPNTIDPNTIE